MKKLKILLFFLSILALIYSCSEDDSQHEDNSISNEQITKKISKGQSYCSTPDSSTNMAYNLSLVAQERNLSSSYCIKIYMHVIRRSNGTGGQSVLDVAEAFNVLNQDFNPHNITFIWDNQIDYIDSDYYYPDPDPNPFITPEIFSENNHTDGIDIYLFDDDSAAGGQANGVGESSELYVSGSFWGTPNNSLVTSRVLSHEMGHVLFLWHTHTTVVCAELVDGSNSAICGDFITDTPADPNLEFDVDAIDCLWNSSGFDSNGDAYNPDESNVMSYTNPECMSYFTPEQGLRMRDAIETLSFLQPVITKCSTIIGGGDDCNYALGILDEYIDGTQSGSNYVYLQAGGNFPLGTTYAWTIKRQDGSIQVYQASVSNPRLVSASIGNRITEATVTAEFEDCTKTVNKTFNCAIPNSDINGDLFPECNGSGGGIGFN